MKKINYLSILLSLSIFLQCLSFPVYATAATPTEVPNDSSLTEQAIIPQEAEPVFGTVSILKGCRTINGMMPLAGSDPRLATAQSVFLYEVNTDTVVYAYNPDTKVHPGTGLLYIVLLEPPIV